MPLALSTLISHHVQGALLWTILIAVLTPNSKNEGYWSEKWNPNRHSTLLNMFFISGDLKRPSRLPQRPTLTSPNTLSAPPYWALLSPHAPLPHVCPSSYTPSARTTLAPVLTPLAQDNALRSADYCWDRLIHTVSSKAHTWHFPPLFTCLLFPSACLFWPATKQMSSGAFFLQTTMAPDSIWHGGTQ